MERTGSTWWGATASEDFRLANPVDGVLTDGGGCKGPCLDGFITKWGSDLDVLWFGTYFGGNADDVVEDVAVEADGTIHVAGWTRTDDGGGFPIANSIASFLGGENAFAAKLIMGGRGNYGIDFSTPLGDSSEDTGSSIALGGADIYVSGSTFGSGEYTAFVARLRSNLMPRGNVVNINFQPKESEIPEGYLPDSGQPYGLQDAVWSYGWVPFGQNDQPKLIANELHEVRDQQYDTYVGLAELEKTVLQWEIGLKRGRYTVRLVVGDPRGTQSPLPSDWAQIYAEGVPFISEWRAVGPGDTWMDRTVTVEVTDGRLTLTLDTRAEEWWLCLAFLEISSATSLNQPPKVSLIAPLGSERFNGGRPVTIHAEAEDSDGKVEKVAFHATNSLGKRFPLGVDTTAPYSVNWGCPAYGIPCNPGVYPGRYRIDAVATDDSGATRQSAPIDIFVERLETKRDSFKAELRIFLPDETMPVPDPLASGDEVTRGDDRDFSSTSQEYRVLQRVTLIPSKALDEDGIEDGSMANLRGGTARYDLGSSVNPVNGRLTPKARSEAFTETNNGFPYMLDYGTLAALPAVIPMPRPGAWTSGAHFTGAVFDPLLVGDCQLLWDLALTIDATDPSFPVARVQGMYGGFPAFEIYVDGEPVYQWKPPAGRTAGHLCKPGAESVDSGPIYLK